MPILSDADVGIGAQAPTLMNDADVGLGAPAQTGSPGLMGALQRVWENPPPGPSLIGAAKSLFQSAQLPGDVMAGRVDPLSEQGIARAAQLAGNVALGGPGGGMFGAAAAPKLAAAKLPTSEQVLKAAGQGYDLVHEAASGMALPEGVSLGSIASDIRTALNAAGKRPSVADRTHSAINELETPATKGAPDVGDLVAARKTLGNLLGTEEAAAAGHARDLLDAKIAQVAPDVMGALKLADRQYNIGMTAKGVEDAAKAAENAALSRQTGLKTPMQTEFRQLAKKNPYSGLTPEEQAQMFRVGGGALNRALQLPAALDPTASRLAALIHGATAAGTVGASVPAQVALGTGGLAARKLMEANIRARAADVARSVLQRSDLGQKALATHLAQPRGPLGLAQAILAAGRPVAADWLTRPQTSPLDFLQAQ